MRLIEKVLRMVSDYYSVPISEIQSLSREGMVVEARAMFCLLNPNTHPAILGNAINRDRTTVIYLLKTYNGYLKNNTEFKKNMKPSNLTSKHQSIMKQNRNHIYIAGKVSGEPYWHAFLKFSAAEKKLKPYGCTINPMRLCKRDWSWMRCMAVCLWVLVFRCNRIYLLHDWRDSKGARIERRVATIFKKRLIEI